MTIIAKLRQFSSVEQVGLGFIQYSSVHCCRLSPVMRDEQGRNARRVKDSTTVQRWVSLVEATDVFVIKNGVAFDMMLVFLGAPCNRSTFYYISRWRLFNMIVTQDKTLAAVLRGSLMVYMFGTRLVLALFGARERFQKRVNFAIGELYSVENVRRLRVVDDGVTTFIFKLCLWVHALFEFDKKRRAASCLRRVVSGLGLRVAGGGGMVVRRCLGVWHKLLFVVNW